MSTKAEDCNVTNLSNIVLESLNTSKISDGVLLFKKNIVEKWKRGKHPFYYAASFVKLVKLASKARYKSTLNGRRKLAKLNQLY